MMKLATLTCAIAVAGGANAQSLDALVTAAKTEPPVTVMAVTGKIVDQAKAFNEKYGLNVPAAR